MGIDREQSYKPKPEDIKVRIITLETRGSSYWLHALEGQTEQISRPELDMIRVMERGGSTQVRDIDLVLIAKQSGSKKNDPPGLLYNKLEERENPYRLITRNSPVGIHFYYSLKSRTEIYVPNTVIAEVVPAKSYQHQEKVDPLVSKVIFQTIQLELPLSILSALATGGPKGLRNIQNLAGVLKSAAQRRLPSKPIVLTEFYGDLPPEEIDARIIKDFKEVLENYWIKTLIGEDVTNHDPQIRQMHDFCKQLMSHGWDFEAIIDTLYSQYKIDKRFRR